MLIKYECWRILDRFSYTQRFKDTDYLKVGVTIIHEPHLNWKRDKFSFEAAIHDKTIYLSCDMECLECAEKGAQEKQIYHHYMINAVLIQIDRNGMKDQYEAE